MNTPNNIPRADGWHCVLDVISTPVIQTAVILEHCHEPGWATEFNVGPLVSTVTFTVFQLHIYPRYCQSKPWYLCCMCSFTGKLLYASLCIVLVVCVLVHCTRCMCTHNSSHTRFRVPTHALTVHTAHTPTWHTRALPSRILSVYSLCMSTHTPLPVWVWTQFLASWIETKAPHTSVEFFAGPETSRTDDNQLNP